MLIINCNDESEFVGKKVCDFIKFKDLDVQKIAVELNGEILPKSMFDTLLKDGDMVEIVHFVGGG
ncbi:MAG: sulfur carrier protein ThiS [Campylobacter sp.]